MITGSSGSTATLPTRERRSKPWPGPGVTSSQRDSWSRGGATGVVQGPDTDLHAWLESELISLQELEGTAKLLERPHKVPTETRQSMSDYATTLWALANHTQGERSFKRNGLNNALDGREDHLISRTARCFWVELDMPTLRQQIEAEVEAFIASTPAITPVNVFDLLQDYSGVTGGGGEEKEGQEVQPALAKNECPYLTGDEDSGESSAASEDEAPADRGDVVLQGAHDTAGSGDGVPPAPEHAAPGSGDVVPRAQASKAGGSGDVVLGEPPDVPVVHDIGILDVLIAVAKKLNDPSTLVLLERQKDRLLRQARRSEPSVTKATGEFLMAAKADATAMQEAARLEDRAKAKRKHMEQLRRSIRMRVPKRKALSPRRIVSPLPLPPPMPPPPHSPPVAPAPAPEPAPPAAPAVHAATVEAPSMPGDKKDSGSKKFKKDAKDHKKDKKHKKEKPPKAKKAAATAVLLKPIANAEMFLSVDFDTEAKVRHVLARLAFEWTHAHKDQLLRWLARDIVADIKQCRAQRKHNIYSRHLRRPLRGKEFEPGVAAKTILERVKNASIEDRRAWFARRYDAMLAAEKKAAT